LKINLLFFCQRFLVIHLSGDTRHLISNFHYFCVRPTNELNVMRKPIIILLSLLLLTAPAFSQMFQPVKWKYTSKKISDCEAELTFTATVDFGWHLYSQKHVEGNPLIFDFKKSGSYKRVGGVSEPTPHKQYDEIMGYDLIYFKEPVVMFRQKITLNADQPFTITGIISGQACLDDGQCVPIQETFSFNVDPEGAKCLQDPNDTDADGVKNADDKCPDEAGIAEAGGCPDMDADGVIDAEDECPEVKGAAENKGCPVQTNTPQEDKTGLDDNSPVSMPQKLSEAEYEGDCGDGEGAAEDKSFIGILIAGFLGGLLALLTPCVFPMIPLTVSFFTKQSKNRAKGVANAFIYAFSIIVIYTGLGFLVTVIAGPDALNNMASSAFWNLLFFVVFVIFAASFLGAFEITLPSRFVNAIDKGSNRGGLIGIFFMAFTLSLVSFSCTGPIIGSLLVEASRGNNYLGPLVGMFGFSLALALPFALFAAFPGWLNSLPRSGGWLNSVKVILGFVELALALKFLSVVDLAYHWGFLKREIFLAIWITIALLAALYLLGTFRLSHDSDEKPKLSVLRTTFAICFLGLAVYMLPGLFGAPTSLFSGYLPPSYYKEWKNLDEKYADCPHGMECYHDYEEGMRTARNRKKPVLLDFTGYACVNCRKMEDNVWSKPEIFKLLTNDYVVVSLYVDDKSLLPADRQYKSLDGSRTLRTYGDKWKDLQTYYFDANAQPYYVLVDNNGRLLAKPRAYTPDAAQYKGFLETGLCRYRSRGEI